MDSAGAVLSHLISTRCGRDSILYPDATSRQFNFIPCSNLPVLLPFDRMTDLEAHRRPATSTD